jgi:hypothetical protein
MGFFRQYRAVAIARAEQTCPWFWRLRSPFICGLVVLFTISLSTAQTTAPRQPPTSTPIAATPTYLDKCNCGDAQRLKDRLEKLKGAALLVARQLQSTPAGKPASRQEWNALQSQIRGYLRAMQIQGLTTFPDDSLFLGNDDPFCGPQTVDAGICLNQDFAVHQIGHDASCRVGNWSWQGSWAEKDMLLEEGNTIETERAVIDETIKRMGGCSAAKVCAQFGIIVQNITTSSINMPGALREQSARSLNNGQGVAIPLTFHADGSFEGFGTGSDAGSAVGAGPGEVVSGRFGHSQSITASGYIRPSGCNTQGCQDVMHLVLAGGAASQARDMQARGVINRDVNSPTPTNAATVEFDLPAYVGGSAQKTFFATPILNSYMTVNLVQANSGTQALPVGSSLLYSLQQCKLGAAAPAGGGGGAAGVVIPGLEGNMPPAGGGPKGTSPGLGISVPGLEGYNPPPNSGQAPVNVQITETIHTTDAAPAGSSSPVNVVITENIKVSDGVGPAANGVGIVINEPVHATDSVPDANSPR